MKWVSPEFFIGLLDDSVLCRAAHLHGRKPVGLVARRRSVIAERVTLLCKTTRKAPLVVSLDRIGYVNPVTFIFMTTTETPTAGEARPPFSNPYWDNDLDGVTLSFRCYKPDWELIKCTRPATATISTCLGLLWKALVYALRRKNITDVTRCVELESFVAGMRIISADEWLEYEQLRGRFPNGTASGPVQPETGPRDERDGTSSVGDTPKNAVEQLPNVPGRRRKTRRGSHGNETGEASGEASHIE